MKHGAKIAIWIGTIVIVVPIMVIATFLYTLTDMCGNDLHKEYPSPNNHFKAVVFQRDCGATTGFSTQISIIDSSQQLDNESGNVYIINGHPDDVAPNLIWESNSELVIEQLPSGSESHAATEWGLSNQVKVTYRAGNS